MLTGKKILIGTGIGVVITQDDFAGVNFNGFLERLSKDEVAEVIELCFSDFVKSDFVKQVEFSNEMDKTSLLADKIPL